MPTFVTGFTQSRETTKNCFIRLALFEGLFKLVFRECPLAFAIRFRLRRFGDDCFRSFRVRNAFPFSCWLFFFFAFFDFFAFFGFFFFAFEQSSPVFRRAEGPRERQRAFCVLSERHLW